MTKIKQGRLAVVVGKSVSSFYMRNLRGEDMYSDTRVVATVELCTQRSGTIWCRC